MIIYGTGNFNRRNQSVVRCGCPSCGRRDFQRSYTSTRFFTLYFIPVIPLGGQKILQECQHCKNAFGLSLSDHKKRIKRDLPKAISDFNKEPSNSERAAKLISTLVSTQETSLLKSFAPQIAARFPRNGELLCSLAEACSYLCLDTLAEEYFLMSVNATDDKEVAKSAAQHMKRKGNTKPTPPNRLLQSLPVFIVPGILLFLFGNMCSKALSNRPENIFLVNGLDQAYQVYVNDKRVQLEPYERLEGSMLHWEKNTIRPVEGSLPIEMQTFDIGSPKLSERAFDDTVFIVNPDRSALLLWQAIHYTTSPDPNDDTRFKVLTGKVAYAQDNIDYAFRESPDKITTASESDRVFRTQLEHIDNSATEDIISWLYENELEVELESYLAQTLKFAKNDIALIRAGLRVLPQNKFLQLAKPHIEARPVEIEWHRAYQDAHDTDQEAVIEAFYRELYSAEPDNNPIAYLYGRACQSPGKAAQIMAKAASSSRPSGYASYGLSYYYMLEGDFESAAKYSEQASNWLPENQGFNYTGRIGNFGSGNYDSIVQETETALAAGLDFEDLYDFAYANAKRGKVDVARNRIESELEAWQKEYDIPEKDASNTRQYLQEAIALSSANKQDYIAIVKKGSTPYHKFESQILEGRLYDAIYTVANDPNYFGASDYLLLSILTNQAGNRDLSQNQLNSAVTALRDIGQKRETKWANWLSEGELPPDEVIFHTCTDFDQQFLLLTALGMTRKSDGEQFVEHARKVVYRESFFSMALREAKVF